MLKGRLGFALSRRRLRCICQGRPETCTAPETASRLMATSSWRGCTPCGPMALCITFMQLPCTHPSQQQVVKAKLSLMKQTTEHLF